MPGTSPSHDASIATFGAIALTWGDLRYAARLCDASEAISQSIHTVLQFYNQEQFQRNVATLRSKLDETELNTA